VTAGTAPAGLTVGPTGPIGRGEGIRQLEVIPVHVLHRPHLPHAAAITAACAALAVVLTLLWAGTLNDFESTAPSSSAAAPAAVRSASTEPGWNVSPFTSLSRSTVRSRGRRAPSEVCDGDCDRWR
jgi:hypothetical protein